jgi:hypothetical protein
MKRQINEDEVTYDVILGLLREVPFGVPYHWAMVMARKLVPAPLHRRYNRLWP